jgi:chemotaxis protein CheD
MEVQMGDVAVAQRGDCITAMGVGSCIVIAIHDRANRIGGLAHAILPTSEHPNRSLAVATHVDRAVDELLKRMAVLGVNGTNLEAKLVGGANMFAAFKARIGEENVSSAREKLKKEGITLVAECVGGSQGRSVEFCISTGVVTVKTKL